MKLSASLFTLIGISLFLPTSAKATPFHCKATALFPVQQEIPDPNPHAPAGSTIVKKVSLGTKEIINLALGVPLETKIASNVVLAVRFDDNDSDPTHQKLVVYDSHNLVELAEVVYMIDPPSANTGSKDGEKGTGNGLSRARLLATTLGAPLTNGFQQNDICGAATGSKTPGPNGPTTKLSMTSIVGPLQAYIGGVYLDGIIIKGMFTAGGKPLDPL